MLNPIAIQQGHLRRVVDVDDCLPILTDAELDAEELACVAERVLLTTLGEGVTNAAYGISWTKVRTPAGIVGWAEDRYLE